MTTPSAPDAGATCSGEHAVPLGERMAEAVEATVRIAVEVGESRRASASLAAGNGPNGPSFDASLTTSARPSSRWTSSAGLPGSYGTIPASAGLKNDSETRATA